MTCIAACRDENNNICMGGDSSGWDQGNGTWMISSDPKVFRKDNMIFGFCQSFRLGQILKYKFQIPKHPKNLNNMEYLCQIFIPKLIKELESQNFTMVENNIVSNNGQILIGYNKHIYDIEESFQIIENTNNYNSIGCGESYAKASFYIIEKSISLKKLPLQEKVRLSLETSMNFSMVKDPFHFVYLPSDSGINKGVKNKK